MEPNHVLIQNEILFGNIFLESIPHPDGFLGQLLIFLSKICHILGGVNFFVIVLPFLFLTYNKIFGIQLGIALLSTSIFNGLAKFYFESVRPYNLSAQIMAVQSNSIQETSYGFPSGHSHVSILVWGLVFLHFKNMYIRFLSIFIILFTPFSRIYAGVHYPGDVIGGFSMGLISLVLIVYFFKLFPNFIEFNCKEENQNRILRTLTLVSIVLTLPSILLYSNGSIQSDSSLQQIITGTGSLAGFAIGYIFLEIKGKSFSKWEKASSINDFLKRTLIILLFVGFFYFGLSWIGKYFHLESSLFRYFRYLILNFSLVGIAPYFFKTNST
jgi:membrane-associated phospholipid phosphatase